VGVRRRVFVSHLVVRELLRLWLDVVQLHWRASRAG
jgi:hypothetical protein